MNGFKLLAYEIKRLIFTKIYAGLLLLTLLFSYYVLSSRTIFGTAYTAPFSQWSFAAYLFDILPFLLLTTLFFCTYVFSKNERRVRTITLTTPLSERGYFLLKACAIALAYLITVLIVFAASLLFYTHVFHFTGFASLLGPLVLVLLPPFVFFFGAAMLLGKTNVNMLYALLLVTFVEGIAGFSVFGHYGLLDAFMVKSYPLTLQVAHAADTLAFDLPAVYVWTRWGWMALGLVLLAIVLFTKRRGTEQ